jgi:hypothetical protein
VAAAGRGAWRGWAAAAAVVAAVCRIASAVFVRANARTMRESLRATLRVESVELARWSGPDWQLQLRLRPRLHPAARPAELQRHSWREWLWQRRDSMSSNERQRGVSERAPPHLIVL